MDFHQVKQILLLVGTNTGDVMVWDVGSGARIALRKFKIWDLGTCSMGLQASLANDYTASVNRVMWSPDGILFWYVQMSLLPVYQFKKLGNTYLQIDGKTKAPRTGLYCNIFRKKCVAYSKDMVRIYSYHGGDDMRNHLEGHEAPVYSICPHNKENIHYVFSIATDGKIKGWLYDNMVSRVDWDAPGHSSTVMAYNVDGTRLFLCGTNKEGESYLVEWNESEGVVKRTYHGLGKRSSGVVQFDTTKNRFLAVGDEFTVKFWDMDNNNILISVDADGGLPASPCIRFNQEGNLLAVSTSDKSIKILANADGIRLLRTVDNRPFDTSRITLGPLMKDSESMADVKLGIADESGDKSRIWRLTEINEPLQCRSIRLPDDSTATRVQIIAKLACSYAAFLFHINLLCFY
ncbi:hypothetical protein EUGRSUZ_C01364 [Eucalyptus grandis]|uniref:Uncharacterized protein n=1 Tax=Eucalyptus grandis TaxID=71139 RepID=A0ACC3LDH5_EUCGR|nr:hypothetical protein EUGRSUZ_C01364 [Eucalyptus grandis]